MNAESKEEHVFRFLQRYEYLQAKFAPKTEYFHLNRNSRTLGEILSVKTSLEGNEVQVRLLMTNPLIVLRKSQRKHVPFEILQV